MQIANEMSELHYIKVNVHVNLSNFGTPSMFLHLCDGHSYTLDKNDRVQTRLTPNWS